MGALAEQEAVAAEPARYEDTQASPEPSEPEKENSAPEKATAPKAPEPKVVPKAEPKVEAKPKPVPKKKERPVLENKWGAPVAPEQEDEEEELTMEQAARVADILEGPSLSDAVKGPEKKKDQKDKIPPPQPKKKEKKKVMKMSASDLGFEC